MEELTKHQLVLVSLLVSFVTSVATGIVTVTLVEQAPQGGVTQTINRVIERTIEKVSTDGTASVSAFPQVVSAPSEEDLAVTAVEKNSKSLVRIKGTVSADLPTPLGLGLVATNDGLIVTDKNLVEEGGSYIAVMHDGKILDLDLVARNESTKLVFFRARLDKEVSYRLYPVALGNSDLLKLGQRMIILAGLERNIIARANITGLITNSDGTPTSIETDSMLNQTGEPLINLAGEVVGIKTFRDGSKINDFLPVNVLKEELKLVIESVRNQ